MIYFKYNKLIEKDHLKRVLLNADTINTVSLKNFAKTYRSLGGKKIPDEIVNMIIRKAHITLCTQNEYVTPKKASLLSSEVIHSISKISGTELWRLSNAFCINQYGFKINYLQWLFNRMLDYIF